MKRHIFMEHKGHLSSLLKSKTLETGSARRHALWRLRGTLQPEGPPRTRAHRSRLSQRGETAALARTSTYTALQIQM